MVLLKGKERLSLALSLFNWSGTQRIKALGILTNWTDFLLFQSLEGFGIWFSTDLLRRAVLPPIGVLR